MPSSPWKMITPQGLICIFWAESLLAYQLCIPVKVRQTPAVKDWSSLLFPWQALPCKKTTFFTSISFPYKSLKQRFSVSPPVNLHQNKFSACKSADDCKQFFCAFCGYFAMIYRNLCRKQRISELDFRQCVLDKISCFSLFLSHLSADDFKKHKSLESKTLQKHTPKQQNLCFGK